MKSPVTKFVGDADKSDPRNRKIIGYGWHHTAGGTWASNQTTMNTSNRGVSCNTLISRLNIGEVTAFNRRAYTTGAPNDGGKGAALDHMSLTSEVVNDVGAPEWCFNDETYYSCALMAAYAFITYGVPLRLAQFYGDAGHWTHGGAHAAWGAGYPTACPGSLDVPRILREAAGIIAIIITGGMEDMNHLEVVRNLENNSVHIINRVTGRSYHVPDPDTYKMLAELGLVPKDEAKIRNLGKWEFYRYLDTFEKLGIKG